MEHYNQLCDYARLLSGLFDITSTVQPVCISPVSVSFHSISHKSVCNQWLGFSLFPGSAATESYCAEWVRQWAQTERKEISKKGGNIRKTVVFAFFSPTQPTWMDTNTTMTKNNSCSGLQTAAFNSSSLQLSLTQSLPLFLGCHSYRQPSCLYFGNGETLPLCQGVYGCVWVGALYDEPTRKGS